MEDHHLLFEHVWKVTYFSQNSRGSLKVPVLKVWNSSEDRDDWAKGNHIRFLQAGYRSAVEKYKKVLFYWLCFIAYQFIKVKLATVVEGNLKAPFSIATTQKCKGWRYSFPWVASLYPYLIILSVKQGSVKYNFFVSLVWLDLGLNPGLVVHWWTL